MAINYIVQAEVVDITIDTPKPNDAFLVDTNVWYWLTYTQASQDALPYQISRYPKYANTALSVSAQLFYSGLSLAELTHLIEKSEYKIFARTYPTVFPDSNKFDKKFRHDHNNERMRVISEIQTVWAQVSDLAEPLPITIDMSTTIAALNRLNTERVDGYDLFILESMKNCGITQVITDDGDFVTVPNIQAFTANRNVIQAAKDQGKLIKRL